jgi:Rab GDP dissociation inhibitor
MAKCSLDDNTVDFVIHAMALQPTDAVLSGPALPVVEAVQLYASSLARFGGSPFIYPAYGLGGLPESFSRLCAVNGGTFMLHQDVDEILYGEDGKVAGIRCGDAAASATTIIGDPSYFPATAVKREGRVIRTICLMNHGVEALSGVQSGQIILPQKQIARQHDVYVTVLGPSHNVVSAGRTVAMVSTEIEGDGDGKDQVAAGVALCGGLIARFDNITDVVQPVEDGTATRAFITSSYDASSHFEATARDVMAMYERITGKPLVLTNPDE